MGSRYVPYEHHLFVEDVMDQINKVLGQDVVFSKEFAVRDTRYYPKVNNENSDPITIVGGQMFGLLKLDLGEMYEGDDLVPSLGIRNSLDGTMSAGVLYGNNCFVCDNMMFTGEHCFTHKHTKNAVVKLIVSVREMLKRVPRLFKTDKIFREELKSLKWDENQSYALIGQLLGNKFMNQTQAMIAINETRNPSYEEFEEPTAWSCFNSITYAKKSGQNPRVQMDDLEKITEFTRTHVLEDFYARANARIDSEESAQKAAYVGPAVAVAELEDDQEEPEDVQGGEPEPTPEEIEAYWADRENDQRRDDEILGEGWEDPNLKFNGGYDDIDEDS